MKTTRRPLAAAAAVLVLALTGCTGGGIFQQDRLEFNTSGMDSEAAKTPFVRIGADVIASDGPEVMLSMSGRDAGGARSVIRHSSDSGKSWEEVRFGGREAKHAPNSFEHAGKEWLALAQENTRLMPYVSTNGREFTAIGKGIVLDPQYDGAMAFRLGQDWAVLSKSDGAFRVHRSNGDAEWTTVKAKGLPVGRGIHLLAAASNGTTMILAGQRGDASGAIDAIAYSSADGGLSWKDISPDASKIAPGNSGFRAAHWDGKAFRLLGFGYPPVTAYGLQTAERQARGLDAHWVPGGKWTLAVDAQWADGKEQFPTVKEFTGSDSRQALMTRTGDGTLADYRLFERRGAQPWKQVHVPAPDKGQHNYLADVAQVADGTLVASTVSGKGTVAPKVLLLDGKGSAQDRTPSLAGPVPESPALSQFAVSEGTLLALGSRGLDAGLWRSEDGRNFKDRTALKLAGPQILSGLSSTVHGELLFGYEDAWNSTKPLLWTRKPGGDWFSYNGDVFGARSPRDTPPVNAALATSRGFLAAGSHPDARQISTSAALAMSKDGRTWTRITVPSFEGKYDNDRAIHALAETSGKTLLAGGFMEKDVKNAPVVWRSTDAKTWAPVALAKVPGYTDSEVLALESGTKTTVALVYAQQEGKGTRYTLYRSTDQGKGWTAGTALPEALGEAAYGSVHLLSDGDGFAVVGTQGTAQDRKPFLYTSPDGTAFQPKELKHEALSGENLDIGAAIIHDGKLLFSGFAGAPGDRKQFALTLEVPR